MIEAIDAEYAGRQERVRTRCRQCGRTLALATPDFADAMNSGSQIRCPSCKTPVPAPAQVATGNHAPRVEPRPPTVVTAPPPGQRTAAVSPPGARGTVAIDAPLRESTIAIDVLKRDGTVAIPAATRADTAALTPAASAAASFTPLSSRSNRQGTVILGPPAANVSSGDSEREESRGFVGNERTPAGESRQALAAAGTGRSWLIAVASIVAVFPALAAMVWTFRPDPHELRVASSVAVLPIAHGGPTAVARFTPAAGEPPAAAIRTVNVAGNARANGVVTPVRAHAFAANGVAPMLTSGFTNRMGDAHGSGPSFVGGPLRGPGEPQTAPAPVVAPDASSAPRAEVDSSPAEEALPLKGTVPLEKILKSPDEYFDHKVELTGLYCVAGTANEQDGHVTLGLIESDLNLRMTAGGPWLEVGHWNSYELGADPQLINQLSRTGFVSLISSASRSVRAPGWDDKVAIVTVVVRKPSTPEMSPCQIVKLEFATHVGPEVVTIARQSRLRVVYRTLAVTAEGQEAGTGTEDVWAPKTGRLRHITTQFHKLIDHHRRTASDARWYGFSSQFNHMRTLRVHNGVRQNAADVFSRSLFSPFVPR